MRVERTGSVGRPQQIYQLTEDAAEFFPKNFAILAAGMVRQIKQVLPADQVDAMFHSMADEMAGEVDMASLEALPLDERLDRVTAFLNERGYLARWEPCDDGDGAHFLLYKHNCPYAGVSGEHRELCLMDQMLIDRLVGVTCSRTTSVANNDRCCTYEIGNGKPALAMQPQEIMLVA